MKKNRLFVLALVLILLLQLGLTGVSAAEETTTETTEQAPIVPATPQTNTFDGTDASITNGCRTINAQMPLYGNNRLLETARCAMLYEVNTGTMVYAYNPDVKYSPSSLVKMMTLLVALENGRLTDEVTVTKEVLDTVDKNSVNIHLKDGEKLTLEQLLYGVMVGSGNDACAVVAQHIAGNQDRFVAMMNKRAEEIGCENTVFVNCHGLEHSKQVSTARDMVRIAVECMKNETFMKIFDAPIYDMPATEKNEKTRWYSNNYMSGLYISDKFYDERVTGGRAGTTGDGGQNLLVTAESGEYKYVAIVMGAERRMNSKGNLIRYYGNFEEVQALLTLGFESQKVSQLLYDGQIADQYQVINGDSQVAVSPEISVRTVLPAKATAEDLTWKTQSLAKSIEAPIAVGDTISLVQIWYGNVCIAQTRMKAANSVGIQATVLDDNRGLFDSGGLVTALIVLGIIFLVILAFFGIMYIIRTIRTARRRSRAKKRRQSRRRSR